MGKIRLLYDTFCHNLQIIFLTIIQCIYSIKTRSYFGSTFLRKIKIYIQNYIINNYIILHNIYIYLNNNYITLHNVYIIIKLINFTNIPLILLIIKNYLPRSNPLLFKFIFYNIPREIHSLLLDFVLEQL